MGMGSAAAGVRLPRRRTSRRNDAGSRLHAVSGFLWDANVTTTARSLIVQDDYLQELIERKPLVLAKR